MVIFRENSEDIYAGIEWPEGSRGAKKLIDFLIKEMGVQEDPLPGNVRASASSRCRAKAPSASCARRSSTRSTTTSRR